MAIAQQKEKDRDSRDRPARESTSTTDSSDRTLTPAEFAYEAAWIGLKEMKLGQIALGKTSDSEVRQFAQKLVADHAGANNRLSQLAGNKGYRLPNTNVFEQTGNRARQDDDSDKRSERQVKRDTVAQGEKQEHQSDLRELRRIQSLSGNEFDRAFLNEVVESHEEAVGKFEHATETVMDEQVKQFAKDALPILENHLNRAQKLVSTKGWDIGVGAAAGVGAANEATRTPANFAYEAFLMSMKEIRAGEIALRKTSDSTVREFAQQMVAAHGGMNNRLMQLSRNKGYEIPSTNLFVGIGDQRDRDQGEKARQGSGARKQTEATRPDSDYDSDRDNNRDRAVSRDSMSAADLDQLRENEQRAIRRLQSLSGQRFDRAYITEMVRDHSKAVRKFQAASENIADEQVKLFAKDALPILQDHLNHAQRIAREKGLNVGRGLGAVEIQ